MIKIGCNVVNNSIETPVIKGFREENSLPASFSHTALNWFTPAADFLANHQVGAGKTLFIGLNGSQGSGKSTLASFLKYYFNHVYSLNVVSMSLDDFYLSSDARGKLAKEVHPLLATRGVPGTHDINLLTNTLAKLKTNDFPVIIPHFNKATDNPAPKETWLTINEPVDVVILEGWCWGARQQSHEQLSKPVNDLEQFSDPDDTWRRYVNNELHAHYEPLYDFFDFWLMLKAPSFSCIYNWRCEQEHKLKASLLALDMPDNKTMSDQEIHEFIQYFQRLTEHCLATLPAYFNLTFELDANRHINRVAGAHSSLIFNGKS